MAQKKDDLGKIYSEIDEIENKIGNLQGELLHLKNKLDKFVRDSETIAKGDYIVDPILEQELTSPITDSFNALPENEQIHTEIDSKANKPSVQTPELKSNKKEPIPQTTIVRPNFKPAITSKKEETLVTASAQSNLQKPIQRPAVPSQTPPDIFEDIKNWIKSKIGDIPVEEFLGVNLLNKIGLVLLVVGFSLFLRLAYDWIGPYTKIIGMLFLSAGVFYGGEKFLRNKSYSIFGLGMIAASFALFYFTSYASYNIEATRILNPDQGLLGFILMLFASGIVISASLRYKQEALTSFAYFLGFLTISMNENSDFNSFSMASVGVLAVSLIGIMTVMRWKYLTGIGILATYGNYWLYANGLPRTPDGYLLKISETGQNYFLESILYLLFFWVIFFISTFTMKIEDKKTEKICSAVNIINAFSFFAMLAYVRPEPTEWGPFLLYIGMGICYLVGAFLGRKYGREFLWNSSIVLGLSLITLAIPAKFSNYGHVFGWLLEGSVLIVLGFQYKERYIKNLGYLVLLLNLGRFFTLPYGDFFYSSSIAYPLLSFDMNRGMIYISMLICFYGLVLFLRNQLSSWSAIDKLAYNSFGALGSLTLLFFSFYVVQNPYQPYAIIPGAGILLYLSIQFRNRNLYFSSASLTVISLLASLELLFHDKNSLHEIHEVISLLLILSGNGIHYYFGKQNLLLGKYLEWKNSTKPKKSYSNSTIRRLFLNGEMFLWVACISFLGIVLNEVSNFIHTASILIASSLFFLLHKHQGQGVRQGVFLFCFAFLVNLFRYSLFQKHQEDEQNREFWIALSNNIMFWFSGIGILFYKNKLDIKEEANRILSPLLISATTLIAMMIGKILLPDMFILSFAAIYSLAIIVSFLKLKDDFCIYNSLLLSWFSLIFGLSVMVVEKETPTGIYEYMNLTTYLISSILTTGLLFQLIEKGIPRLLTYLQSILTSICFIIIVVPDQYRPIAFAFLHFGHLFFLFKFQVEKFYEYSYLTLGISVLSFLNHTQFPNSGRITNFNEIALVVGYSLLSIMQTIFIFINDTKVRDRYTYYILNCIILFWGIHISVHLEYGVLLFAIFVYSNSFLLNKFGITEIENLYYYPLGFTIFSFFYRLLSDKPNVIEEMDYESFTIGLVTLFLLLRSVKDAEDYKSKQPDFVQEKYSFDRIVTLVLFLEFILLTMTVIDIRWWSLVWTVEAMGFIVYGLFKKQPLIRYAGIGLIGLAVVKVGFWDLKNLQENVRVLVLLSIGGLFVTGSFLYAKYKDRLFKEEDFPLKNTDE